MLSLLFASLLLSPSAFALTEDQLDPCFRGTEAYRLDQENQGLESRCFNTEAKLNAYYDRVNRAYAAARSCADVTTAVRSFNKELHGCSSTTPQAPLKFYPGMTREQFTRIVTSQRASDSAAAVALAKNNLATVLKITGNAAQKDSQYRVFDQRLRSIQFVAEDIRVCVGNQAAAHKLSATTIGICPGFLYLERYTVLHVLLHELAHANGVHDECTADLVAHNMEVLNGFFIRQINDATCGFNPRVGH